MNSFLGIQIRGLWKAYAGRWALRDVHLSLPPGSVCCLLGANGAGKTTLLHCAIGLTKPSRGSVRVNGMEGTPREAPWGRELGFLPQRASLYEHLSLREHLLFVGQLYGLGAGLAERVDRELTESGLHGQAQHLAQTLSPGTRQKAALIATRLHEPSLLVYDEPTAPLDAQAADRLGKQVREFAEDGRLAWVATHDLDWAERVAERLSVLHRGRLIFDGSPGDLRRALHAPFNARLRELFLRLLNEERRGAPRPGGRLEIIR